MNGRIQSVALALLVSACVAPPVTEAELRDKLTHRASDSFSYLIRDKVRPPALGLEPPCSHPDRFLIHHRSFLPPAHQPDLHGTVVLREGTRIAVRLDEPPPKTWDQRIDMAIFSATRQYMGELAVREFYRGHALGELTFQRREHTVQVGDLAACKVE